MNTTIRCLAIPFLLAALLLPLLAAAATYRWTDAEGRLQYSDRPPADIEAERLYAPPPPPLEIPVEAAPATPAEQAKARDDARRAEEDRAYQAGRVESCKRARENLARIQSGKIGVRGADGKMRAANPAERRDMLAKSRAAIVSDCE